MIPADSFLPHLEPRARQRRELVTRMAGAAALTVTLGLPRVAGAQNDSVAHKQARLLQPNPEAFRQALERFTEGKKPGTDGLVLDVPALADNPSAVPVRVSVTLPVSDENWCEELILLAEKNPIPLACRLYFTPLAGVADAAVRIRLSQSQTVHALARMKDGRLLQARQAVTVAASGCGM